jgi:hypothetical protein
MPKSLRSALALSTFLVVAGAPALAQVVVTGPQDLTPTRNLETDGSFQGGSSTDVGALQSQIDGIMNDTSLSEDEQKAAITTAVNNATSSNGTAACAEQLDDLALGLESASVGVELAGTIAEAIGAAFIVTEIPGVILQGVGTGLHLGTTVVTGVQNGLPNCNAQFTGTVEAWANVAAGQGISAFDENIILGNDDGVSYYQGITLGGGNLAGAGSGGADAITGHVDAIAIGNGSQATSQNGTALGTNAYADGVGATALGAEADAVGVGATAVGYDANATGVDATAVGAGATANGVGATALGADSNASAAGATALGNAANATGVDAVAVGDADATAANAVAAGNGANASQTGATAVGTGSLASGSGSAAFGQGASATATNAVALGDATAGGTSSAAVGNNSTASATGATAVGNNSTASAAGASALGENANATGADSTAVGDADATQFRSLAIGQSSSSTASGGAAFGSTTAGSTTASGTDALAVQGGSASGASSIAVGVGSSATQASSLAIGTGASSTGANAIAIGKGATATGSVAIGDTAFASNGGAAFGDFSRASGVDSAALGPNARATGNRSTAMGAGTQAVAAGSVAIGADSFGGAAMASLSNQMVLGTSNHTYTASGIASDLSKSRQLGQVNVVTNDQFGNLADDGGEIFQRLDEHDSGIAMSLAMANPSLVEGEKFGIATAWGTFAGAHAFTGTAMGVVGEDLVADGDRLAVFGGVGIGFEHGRGDTVYGGRAGMQWTY